MPTHWILSEYFDFIPARCKWKENPMLCTAFNHLFTCAYLPIRAANLDSNRYPLASGPIMSVYGVAATIPVRGNTHCECTHCTLLQWHPQKSRTKIVFLSCQNTFLTLCFYSSVSLKGSIFICRHLKEIHWFTMTVFWSNFSNMMKDEIVSRYCKIAWCSANAVYL